MSGWRAIETAPKGEYIMLGYSQQGDEMPQGLFVGIGIITPERGKLWMMNAEDNEKAWPSHWQPLPSPPTP